MKSRSIKCEIERLDFTSQGTADNVGTVVCVHRFLSLRSVFSGRLREGYFVAVYLGVGRILRIGLDLPQSDTLFESDEEIIPYARPIDVLRKRYTFSCYRINLYGSSVFSSGTYILSELAAAGDTEGLDDISERLPG